MTGAGFPHSDTLGSTLGWQLPEAYRSLPRPSSAPDAQASTVCPSQLDHTTQLRKTIESTKKDARVHCAVLNVPPAATPPCPARPQAPSGAERYETQDGPGPRINGCPLPQDPTACLRPAPSDRRRSTPRERGCTSRR